MCLLTASPKYLNYWMHVVFLSPFKFSASLIHTHTLAHARAYTHTGKAFNTLANCGPLVRFLEGDVYPQQCLSLRHVAWVNNTVKPKTMCVPDDCNYL